MPGAGKQPPGPPRTGGTPSPLTRGLILAALAAVTFAVFSGVLHNGWIQFDDPTYVRDNRHVNRGVTLDGIAWFLGHEHSANWHPLTSLSHMLDVTLFGLNPAGHHATSLVLHLLNAILLVLLLHRMTGAWWRSLLVGAFFALHPLRVESVAWISERKDVLSGCFFLLALAAWVRWTARPGRARYAALIALFALGLTAKPMLLTLPFVLLLLDGWPLERLAWGHPGAAPAARPAARSVVPEGETRVTRGRSPIALIVEKWPLLALAAASVLVTFIFQRHGGALTLTETVGFGRRAANAFLSYGRYLEKTFWPAGLAPYYPYGRGAGVPAGAAAAVGVAGLTVAAIRQFRKRPYLTVGWLWYLGMLVPVMGFVQVGGQTHADRYTYLPGIGLAIALVWWVGDLVAGSRPGRLAAVAVAVAALAGLSVTTVRQVARWKDTRTLFTHTIKVTRNNVVAYTVLGTAALHAGDAQSAISNLETAVRLAPAFADAHGNLGSALALQGRHDEAIPHFEAVLRAQPDSPDAHNNLGISLAALGRVDEAIPHFRAALRGRETAGIHQNLGIALAKRNQTDEAIEEYRAALRLEPGRYESLLRLGAALASRGRYAEAEAPLRRVLEMKPGDAEARRLLEGVLQREGKLPGGAGSEGQPPAGQAPEGNPPAGATPDGGR